MPPSALVVPCTKPPFVFTCADAVPPVAAMTIAVPMPMSRCRTNPPEVAPDYFRVKVKLPLAASPLPSLPRAVHVPFAALPSNVIARTTSSLSSGVKS